MKHFVIACFANWVLVVLLTACASNSSVIPRSRTPKATVFLVPSTSALTTPELTETTTPAVPLPTITVSITEKAVLMPQVMDWNGLYLEDYELPSEQEIALPDGGEYYADLPPSLFEKQQNLLQSNNWPTITQTNSILAPFGYHLEGDFEYALYEGDNLLKDNLASFGRISVNESRQDFVIIVGEWDNTWLVRKGQIEAWDKSPHFYQSPFYIGEDLFMTILVVTDAGALVRVERNGETAFERPVTYLGTEGCPVEQFREWDGHWVLEVESEIIIDGVSLAKTHRYDLTFNWELMNDKPIYLFQKAGRFGVIYNDQELPLVYEQIIHYQCIEKYGGSLGPYDVTQNNQILTFFARKEGRWHFVQIILDGSQ